MPERVGTIRVSSGLLPMMGAKAQLGRLFQPEDDAPGQAATAVLSHGLWTRRYGADPHVTGRTIDINGQPHTVVGVVRKGFSLPRKVLPTLGVVADGDIYLPLPLAADAATVRTREDYNIMALRAPGVTVAAAQSEMDALTASLRETYPDVYPPNGGLTFSVVPLRDQVVGEVALSVVLLVGAGLLVRSYARLQQVLLYRPLTQSGARSLFVTMRSDGGDARGLMTATTAAIRALDADLPIYRMQTMAQRVEASLAQRRFAVSLLTLFAGVAVILASVGIGSVLAYLVAQGTRELGIRLALGATPAGLVALVLGQALTVTLIGAGVGLAAAWALSSAVSHLLFDVSAPDPMTFAVMTLIPIAVGALASLVPARRAARVDPLVSLRQE